MKLKNLPLISETAVAVPELELVHAPGPGPYKKNNRFSKIVYQVKHKYMHNNHILYTTQINLSFDYHKIQV